MAILESNTDLDVKGRVLATTVPNSTGSIVTWNSTSNVFGLRTNAQIISDLGLSTVVSNSHSHSNLTVLNGITSTLVSNWNTAYGWGNFRDYGLGEYVSAGTGSSPDTLGNNTGFYLSQNSPPEVGGTHAKIINLGNPSASAVVGQIALGHSTSRMAFRQSLTAPWLELYHTGNLTNVSQLNNDAGYLTSSTANYIAIGNGSQTGTSNGNAENLRNGSVWSTPTTGGIPSSNGAVVSFNPYTNGNYGFQLGARGNRFYGRTLENGTLNNWVEFIHTGNISSNLSGYVPTSRTITAGNGLSGGGSLAANRTISLGTPSNISATTTNSLTSTSHTHALTSETITFNSTGLTNTLVGFVSGITGSPYPSGSVIGFWNNLHSSNTYGAGFFARDNRAWFLTKEAGTIQSWNELYHTGNFNPSDYATVTQLSGYVPTGRTITAGNGLSGGGNLTANRTITLGTPSSIGLSTTNSVTSTSHTHELDAATTTAINNGNTAFGWVSLGGVSRTSVLLNSSNDLDLVVNPGYYHHIGGSAPLNKPVSGTVAGYLEVTSDGAGLAGQFVRQVWRARDSSGEYQRTRSSSGNWSAWVEGITTDNLDSQATSLGFIKSSALSGYVPTSRTITINGVAQNLSANRTWTIADTVTRLRGTTSGTYVSGDLTLLAGSNTSISQSGNNITISSTNTDAITSISRNGVNIPIVSQNVDIPVFSTSGAGLVPARVGSVATKYLREDGTWVTPTNTTYSAGTLALLQAGTNTTNRLWSAKILADGVIRKGVNNVNPAGQAFSIYANEGTLDWDGNGFTFYTDSGQKFNYIDDEQAIGVNPFESYGFYLNNQRLRFTSNNINSELLPANGVSNSKLPVTGIEGRILAIGATNGSTTEYANTNGIINISSLVNQSTGNFVSKSGVNIIDYTGWALDAGVRFAVNDLGIYVAGNASTNPESDGFETHFEVNVEERFIGMSSGGTNPAGFKIYHNTKGYSNLKAPDNVTTARVIPIGIKQNGNDIFADTEGFINLPTSVSNTTFHNNTHNSTAANQTVTLTNTSYPRIERVFYGSQLCGTLTIRKYVPVDGDELIIQGRQCTIVIMKSSIASHTIFTPSSHDLVTSISLVNVCMTGGLQSVHLRYMSNYQSWVVLSASITNTGYFV